MDKMCLTKAVVCTNEHKGIEADTESEDCEATPNTGTWEVDDGTVVTSLIIVGASKSNPEELAGRRFNFAKNVSRLSHQAKRIAQQVDPA